MADPIDTAARRIVRDAESPWTILRHDGRAVLAATWRDGNRHNLSLIASGTAFWGFAAIAPMLAATVLTYGLISTPASLTANIHALFGVLPRDAAALISDQLASVVTTSGSKKGWGLILALLLALYGGTQGASAIITALNIAYGEQETRGFVRLYLIAFAITGLAVLLALGASASTALTAFIDSLLPGAAAAVLAAIRIASNILLAGLAMTGAALLYRYGPDRTHAQWIWLTPGSVIATLLWLAVTAAFAFYVSNFGNYGATYGSLSAVVVLLVWLWLSTYVFLLGAELNSQLERRTAKDTTIGPPATIGERGAAVADMAGTVLPEDKPVEADHPAKPTDVAQNTKSRDFVPEMGAFASAITRWIQDALTLCRTEAALLRERSIACAKPALPAAALAMTIMFLFFAVIAMLAISMAMMLGLWIGIPAGGGVVGVFLALAAMATARIVEQRMSRWTPR